MKLFYNFHNLIYNTLGIFVSFVSSTSLFLFWLQLWVGPGSKAAEEKKYFDEHLAPFYRIEEVSLCTVLCLLYIKIWAQFIVHKLTKL